MSRYEKFTSKTFGEYIKTLAVSRSIKRVQLHHTYRPSYAQFTGSNHETLQENMRNYHVNTNGWADIAQHFTIFPDGVIMTGRSINTSPAGIYGANTGSICIECVGDFDKGGDVMSDAQKDAIVAAVKILLDRFGLSAADGVTYHAWWTSSGKSLEDYVKGKSAKTCPGTNFFGGNTMKAYRNNLQPLIEKYGKAQTNSSILYRVQVGAFRYKKGANELAATLRAAGFGTYIVIVGGLYKVQVGAYENKSYAQALRQKLERAGFDAFITSQSGEAASSESDSLQVGDKVKLSSKATMYGSSSRFKSWVYDSTLYVRDIKSNRIIISTKRTGDITGAVDKKYLTKI